MLRAPLFLATSLLAASPAIALQSDVPAAQTSNIVQRWPTAEDGDKPAPTVRGDDGQRQAVPRENHPRAESRPAAAAAPAAVAVRATQPQPASAPVAADDQRRNGGDRSRGGNPQTGSAVPRGERPRDGNPQTGQAVPRAARPAPGRPVQTPRGGGRSIYVAPPVYNYYYYPRRYYPYGYGTFGLGYFYYDPYTWYPPNYGYSGGYYGGYGGYGYDIGEVRLRVLPSYADVYVDGYYAGRVDDYDGTFQALRLESGTYHIQIVAPGYAPLDFDIRINPGQKITYRGDLRPFRP